MIQKIKLSIASIISVVTVALLGLAVPVALAQGADIGNSTCQGVSNLNLSENIKPGGCGGLNTSANTVNNALHTGINIFSIIVGIIAVIMIVLAGFKYITSGGSDDKVKSAKNTIVYAVVGLIIVALAQFIVKFILTKATNA